MFDVPNPTKLLSEEGEWEEVSLSLLDADAGEETIRISRDAVLIRRMMEAEATLPHGSWGPTGTLVMQTPVPSSRPSSPSSPMLTPPLAPAATPTGGSQRRNKTPFAIAMALVALSATVGIAMAMLHFAPFAR